MKLVVYIMPSLVAEHLLNTVYIEIFFEKTCFCAVVHFVGNRLVEAYVHGKG
jgi:hypothetical protein